MITSIGLTITMLALLPTHPLQAGMAQTLQSSMIWSPAAPAGTLSSIPDAIDARLSSGAWNKTDCDDSGWTAAAPINGCTWRALQARHPSEKP